MTPEDLKKLIEPGVSGAGSRWAELGAGEGNFTLVLADLLGPAGQVWAVDKDNRALARLRQRMGSRNIETTRADFTHQLEGREASFDGILMANSLHFVKDKPRALSSVLRLLNPTGRLLLVEYDTDRGNPWVPYPLSYESWRKLAPAIGLTEPRRLATYPSQWANQMYSAGSELLRPERTASA